MTKLALSDDVLLQVEKPARYIGSEINAVYKDKEKIGIRFAMCFPDVYEIGMSHLGIQIIYDQFNRRSDVWCERVYSPWPDLDAVMRTRKIPLFALESQESVRDFDFLGITIQYELCYTNILQVLDLSMIPLHAEDRTKEDPIVIGGGPCATNPEPLADFFDLFYIGESETSYDALFDLYLSMGGKAGDRKAFLREAAKIPGIYVPSLYEVTYHEDGTIASFTPRYEDVPKTVRRQAVTDLTDSVYPEKPVVPYVKAVQEKVTLEIMRGCIRGCRFCQAGMIYRPTRERDPGFLRKRAETLLASTGMEELTLSSLSSSDYTHLDSLLRSLIDLCNEKTVNISLPSLRVDRFSLDVMSRVQDVKKSSLTFAPEAGSQRLRDVINKGITEEDILRGCREAFAGGWTDVKLYFMLGLPTETEEDRKDIAHLAQKITDVYYAIPKEERHGKCQITASSSFFVTKPFTPFQWASMFDPEDYISFAGTVRAEMKEMKNNRSIRYNWHEPDVTVIEGVLARGDRRLAPVIESVYRKGGIFDAWTDYFDMKRWEGAFRECGIDPAFYTKRPRTREEILPWDFIDAGVTKAFLWKEWERAQKGLVTANCRIGCSGCGAASYGCGVCFEERNAPEENGMAGAIQDAAARTAEEAE